MRKSPLMVEEAEEINPWSKNQELAVEEARRYVVPPSAVSVTLGSVALPCESDPHRRSPLVSVSMVSQSASPVSAKEPEETVMPPVNVEVAAPCTSKVPVEVAEAKPKSPEIVEEPSAMKPPLSSTRKIVVEA